MATLEGVAAVESGHLHRHASVTQMEVQYSLEIPWLVQGGPSSGAACYCKFINVCGD